MPYIKADVMHRDVVAIKDAEIQLCECPDRISAILTMPAHIRLETPIFLRLAKGRRIAAKLHGVGNLDGQTEVSFSIENVPLEQILEAADDI